MDPYTLATALLILVSLLGADAVIFSGSINIDVAAAPQLARMDKLSFDQPTLEEEFEDQLNRIATTQSLITAPKIRSTSNQGIAMALARAANGGTIAFALQDSLGLRPDRLRLALFVEGGELRGLVSGNSVRTGPFDEVLVPAKDEGLLDFVRRCAVWGGAKLAPYSTALYLLQVHSGDLAFDNVILIATRAKALLPPTPISKDRSLLDNLLGIVALFRDDSDGARAAFDAAMASDPADAVPVLNAAFTDLQFNEFARSAQRMERLLRDAPPDNNVLLGTAYMTWAAALMGQYDVEGAERLLAKATEINPDSSSAWDLWSEAKHMEGDPAAGDRLHVKALEKSATMENYAEVAALYFHLSWTENRAVKRSQFSNPGAVVH